MPRHTSVAEPVRVVVLSLDHHVAGAIDRAREHLRAEIPGLVMSLHAASDWGEDPSSLAACKADIAEGHIIFVSMLFMEDHIQAVLPDLQARREHCDAMVCCISAGEVIRLTRLGGFRMDGPEKGPLALLKKLRGSKKKSGGSDGANQMAMLRRLPKILRFIPGKAQDVRAYFLAMQYWLSGSGENIVNLVRYLIGRYADGPRRPLRSTLKAASPIVYPDTGLYHPRLPERIAENAALLPEPKEPRGAIGLLLMRSYVLAGDTAHYDGVIAAFESRGFRVIPAFASGLDARPAIEKYFMHKERAAVDAVVSLTGFSLVGGPAFNDSHAAQAILARLDVPYLSAQTLELQTIEQWSGSARGLLPIESTMMVAIPEIDGATGPIVIGGRAAPGAPMQSIPDRIEMLVARVARLTVLRKTPRGERNVAIVLFNFPPNGGATGTAAHLSVFESLHNTLAAMKREGYDVELPRTVDDLRDKVLAGNAGRFGADANVHARISADDHVRREPWLAELEAQWGPAPGRHQSDGSSIFVLGAKLGRVFIGIQPAFGHEGDPMRLMFESGLAPTHAFSAFYRYLREDLAAHVVLHFGTHGALEFMPGKQSALSSACWPDRLIGDLPNLYLYAANNPSEGTIAKRRSAATLISYLTPPIAQAGLYRGLLELRQSLDRFRGLSPADGERVLLISLIQAQAAGLDLAQAEPAWGCEADARIHALLSTVREYEQSLIPCGMHVVGEAMSAENRAEYLAAIAENMPQTAETSAQLETIDRQLSEDHELPALIHALDAGFVKPAPGGDLLRSPDSLPTGRNVHGFDPFRIPSAFAVADGALQAERLIARYRADGNALPESIALVLWGTDNIKSEGCPIGQALALIGARPRFDSYGRLCGASLVPLEELGRPRIDVVVTLSGIFRDLLPLQTKLLAEASFLAASADEPLEQNFVRRNALRYQAQHGGDLESAALRVFGNADGAYGSNVNMLIESGAWEKEDELAETYSRRKCFAYGRNGKPLRKEELLKSALSNVQLAYQNLESVELGVTTVDHYFDTLGGINRAVRRAKGEGVPIYIGDQTRGEGTVRTLSEQVALESRTRALNPKWYEEMLKHGAEGVRQIEAHVTNTMGWSATTGQVEPWVYKQLTLTYVLDPAMRERLARLNPKASVKLANRLLEAQDRNYWKPESSMLDALKNAGEELEDQLEGIGQAVAA